VLRDQCSPVEPRRVRVLHKSSGWGKRTRHADADRGLRRDVGFKSRDQRCQSFYTGSVVGLWCGYTALGDAAARSIENDARDFSAAKIDTDPIAAGRMVAVSHAPQVHRI
jgi:hypothetical protein